MALGINFVNGEAQKKKKSAYHLIHTLCINIILLFKLIFQ